MPGLPEVSLITSWHGGASPPAKPPAGSRRRDAPPAAEPPMGLTHALQSGHGLLDLYFLSHTDLPWYIHVAGRRRKWKEKEKTCPLCFAASLERPEIERIANALLDVFIDAYAGRLIGPRPRFAALATYWPLICDIDDDLRNLSIKALQNTLVLARYLGCRHVEIVGGAAFSPEDGKSEKGSKDEDRLAIAERIREERLVLLSSSICQVLTTEPERYQFHIGGKEPRCPYLCLEMEPGSAFLMRDVQAFHRLYGKIKKSNAAVARQVLLNIDLAHMFLADTDAEGPLTHAGERQLKFIREKNLKRLIGHFHVSDHARSHASDLCPGTYHFYNPDYRPWLELAAELSGKPTFSNAVAVEMEAASDIHEVLRVVGRTKAWLQRAAPKPKPGSHAPVEGIILVVDVVKSTELLALGGLEAPEGAKRIDLAISAICRVIHRCRGDVYSFTGDGVIAVFEKQHFSSKAACVDSACRAGRTLFSAMKSTLKKSGEWTAEESHDLALRVALHWGKPMIPGHGPLRQQVLGSDVIVACRLLNAAEVRKGERLPKCRFLMVASRDAIHHTPADTADPLVRISSDAVDDAGGLRGLTWNKLPDHVLRSRKLFKGLSSITMSRHVKGIYEGTELDA